MDKICEKFPSFRRVNSVAVTAGSRYHERKKGTTLLSLAFTPCDALELRKNPKTAQNPDADPELQTLHAAYALANRRRARFRQLMRHKPATLTKFLKAGMSLNQIFRKMPRKVLFTLGLCRPRVSATYVVRVLNAENEVPNTKPPLKHLRPGQEDSSRRLA